MTHIVDLNRIEIKHLRDMLEIFKAEIVKLKDMNRTLQAKNELYLQQYESEHRKSKV